MSTLAKRILPVKWDASAEAAPEDVNILQQATVRGTARAHNPKKRGATPRPATILPPKDSRKLRTARVGERYKKAHLPNVSTVAIDAEGKTGSARLFGRMPRKSAIQPSFEAWMHGPSLEAAVK